MIHIPVDVDDVVIYKKIPFPWMDLGNFPNYNSVNFQMFHYLNALEFPYKSFIHV